MAGLDATGLTRKDLEGVLDDLRGRAQSEFGTEIKTGPTSVLGHLLGIVATGLVTLWESVQASYDALDPDQAQGAQLDNLCALTGIVRQGATKTTGTVTISGDVGAVIPAGKLVRDAVTEVTFRLSETATVGSGGTVDVTVEAEDAGAVESLAGNVTEIVTPVPGWDSVTNAADFNTGEDAETDAELRIRRAQSLQVVGAGPDQAIRARLEEVVGVSAARVISNRTLETDALGIPAKAFRAVLWPDTLSEAVKEAVAQVIWETMPAGIEPDGDEQYSVTDAYNYSQIVKFSFATDIRIYVEVGVTTNANFPDDGDDQVLANVQAVLDALSVGDTVRVLALLCAAALVPGVTNASVKVDTVSPPVSTTDLTIDATEIAVVVDAVNDVTVVVS